MQNLIDAIKNRLLDKVDDLKKVDVFNGQFEAMERQEQTPFPFPVVFIEIEPFEWIRRGDGINVADLRLNFHVGIETYIEDNSHLYELIDKVSGALVRYAEPNCFSPLMKEEEIPDSDHDNFIDHQMIFKTRYLDLSGWRQNDKVKFDTSKLGIGIDVEPPEFDRPEVVVKGDNFPNP